MAIIPGNHEESWLWCERMLGNDLLKIIQSPQPFKTIMQAVPDLVRKYPEEYKEIFNEHAMHAILINIMKLYADERNRELVDWYRNVMLTAGIAGLKFKVEGWDLIMAHSDVESGVFKKGLYPCNPQKTGEYVKRLLVDQKISDRTILLHGHTHIPIHYQYSQEIGKEISINYDTAITSSSSVTVINPGSLGQPRDCDTRPALAIIDLDRNAGQFSTTYHRLLLPDEERIAYLTDLRASRVYQVVLNIAERALTPSECNNQAGLKLMGDRAGSYFLKGSYQP